MHLQQTFEPLSFSSAVEDVGRKATTKDDDDDRKHDSEDLASRELLIARSTTVGFTRKRGVLGVASLVLSSVLEVDTPSAVAIVSVSTTVTVSILTSEVSRAGSIIEGLARLSSRISAVHAASGTGVRTPSTIISSSTSWASGLLAARNFASHGVIEQARRVFGLSGISFNALIVTPTAVCLGETTVTILLFGARRFTRAASNVGTLRGRRRCIDASLCSFTPFTKQIVVLCSSQALGAVLAEIATVEIGRDRAGEISFCGDPFARASCVERAVDCGFLTHSVGVVHLAITTVSFNQASLTIGVRRAW